MSRKDCETAARILARLGLPQLNEAALKRLKRVDRETYKALQDSLVCFTLRVSSQTPLNQLFLWDATTGAVLGLWEAAGFDANTDLCAHLSQCILANREAKETLQRLLALFINMNTRMRAGIARIVVDRREAIQRTLVLGQRALAELEVADAQETLIDLDAVGRAGVTAPTGKRQHIEIEQPTMMSSPVEEENVVSKRHRLS